MSPTIRQSLALILKHGPQSAHDLAVALDLTPREVEEHLAHLQRSLKNKLQITPARCRACGFRFSKRQRLDAPGRCPKCRHQRIEGPLFQVRA